MFATINHATHDRKTLSSASVELDSAQQAAWRRLQQIAAVLRHKQPPASAPRTGLFTRLLRRGPVPLQPVRGLYLWGSVGRGKTLLMDRFFQSLALSGKRRLHYLRFMQQIDSQLKTLAEHSDPLVLIAERWARRHRVLCLDEFAVNDITNAMLLAGLLKALFERGVTLVTTLTSPPVSCTGTAWKGPIRAGDRTAAAAPGGVPPGPRH